MVGGYSSFHYTARERKQKPKDLFLGLGQWKERGCERREKPEPLDVKEQRVCSSYDGRIWNLFVSYAKYMEYSQSKQCNYLGFALCQRAVRPALQPPRGSCADLHVSRYTLLRDTEALRGKATFTFLRTAVNFLFLLGFLCLTRSTAKNPSPFLCAC